AQLATSINLFLYGACKTVVGGSRLIDALSSDSRSSAVDSYKEFAIIPGDLLKTNATSTKSKIDGMLPNGGNDATTRCLRPCQAVYEWRRHRGKERSA
uniref:Uncharacterized protein n=1 Tax=Oryza brachyantha TaxID=4533 RepID=J3M670_ORYBR